jgi:hypothetical protein
MNYIYSMVSNIWNHKYTAPNAIETNSLDSILLKAAQEGNLELIQTHSEKLEYNFKLSLMTEAAKHKKNEIIHFFIQENILDKKVILSRVTVSDNLPLLKDLLKTDPRIASTANTLIEDAVRAENTPSALYLVDQGASVDEAFSLAVRQQNDGLIQALKNHPRLTAKGIEKALDNAAFPYKHEPINGILTHLEPNLNMMEELLTDHRLEGKAIDNILKNPFISDSAQSKLLQHPNVSAKGINDYLSRAFYGYVTPFGMQKMPLGKYEDLTKHPKSDETTLLLILFYDINNLSSEVTQRQFRDPRLSLNGFEKLMQDLSSDQRPWSQARQSKVLAVQKQVQEIEHLIENKRKELKKS